MPETVRPPIPLAPSAVRRVRLAAILLVAYGLVVVINAAYLQSLADWAEWPQFSRALVRLGGMLLFAWGLLRGERWAWWGAVGLGLFWLVTGGLVLVGSLLTLGAVAFPIPLLSQILLVLGVLMLATAVALLLTSPVRAAVLRRPAS